MEAVVLASMVSLQLHLADYILADYTLADLGQESQLGQDLNGQLVGVGSQPGARGSHYILEVLGMLLVDTEEDTQRASLFPGEKHSSVCFVCP